MDKKGFREMLFGKSGSPSVSGRC